MLFPVEHLWIVKPCTQGLPLGGRDRRVGAFIVCTTGIHNRALESSTYASRHVVYIFYTYDSRTYPPTSPRAWGG